MGKMFTTKEVADYFRVTERTVFNWMEKGTLVGFKIGAQWRFSEEEILKFQQKSLISREEN